MSQNNGQTRKLRREYQRPEVARIQVDPITDLLNHPAKANEQQLGCGSDPAHHSPS